MFNKKLQMQIYGFVYIFATWISFA